MTEITKVAEVTLVNEDSEVIKIRECSEKSSYAIIEISGEEFSFEKCNVNIIIDALDVICAGG